VSVHPLLERAHDLDPLIRRMADETEAAGTLPPALAATLREAGLFSALVPAEVGGEGADLLTALEAIETVSRADGSTGWAVMANASAGAMVAAHVGDRAAEAIFGSTGGKAVIAGQLSPGGSCIPVDGGYKGGGSYHFGSGSGHADWLTAGMLVLEDGKPRKLPSGLVEVRVAVVPRAAVQFSGNWDVMGLNGTGSFDYEMAEQFVDADYTFLVVDRYPRRGGRLFEVDVFGLAALGHGAVALGIAARAIEEIARIAPAKKRLGYRDGVGQHPLFLHDFAHTEAEHQAARAYLYDVFGRAQAILDAGGELTDEHRARFRQALTYVHHVAERVVEACYRWAGTDAFRVPSVLGRCLRDIHGATQHLFVDPLTYVDAAPAILRSWQAPPATP
jgi:alkylation response protein AidB-like acyl-CoA dehydrogenase